jgi:hypothetical protein
VGDDSGQVGGIEAIPLGVLVFVVGALLCANAWAVVDAKLAVEAAAREATRSYVEGSGNEAEAVAQGLDAIAVHGRDPDRSRVWLSELSNGSASATFGRCARATFTATYEVPALTVPWIGGFGDGFTVTARHSELVDRFRDGVPGDGSSC